MQITVNTDDCWLYAKSLDAKGYARLNNTMIHRYMYEEVNGKIPNGLVIDHLCRVRHCINPNHLEVVTSRVNTQRGLAVKTHCKWGHEFTPENSYLHPKGGRQCKKCHNRRHMQYYYRDFYPGKYSSTNEAQVLIH